MSIESNLPNTCFYGLVNQSPLTDSCLIPEICKKPRDFQKDYCNGTLLSSPMSFGTASH